MATRAARVPMLYEEYVWYTPLGPKPQVGSGAFVEIMVDESIREMFEDVDLSSEERLRNLLHLAKFELATINLTMVFSTGEFSGENTGSYDFDTFRAKFSDHDAKAVGRFSFILLSPVTIVVEGPKEDHRLKRARDYLDKVETPSYGDVKFVLGSLNFRLRKHQSLVLKQLEDESPPPGIPGEKPFNAALSRLHSDRKFRDHLVCSLSIHVEGPFLRPVIQKERFEHFSTENRNVIEMSINLIRKVKSEIGDRMGHELFGFLWEVVRLVIATDWPSRSMCILSLLALVDDQFMIDALSKVLSVCKNEEELVYEDDCIVPEGLSLGFVSKAHQLIVCRVVDLWKHYLTTKMFSSCSSEFKKSCFGFQELASVATNEASFLFDVISFLIVTIENVVAFAKTGDYNDLLGRSPNLVWFDNYTVYKQDYEKYRKVGGDFDELKQRGTTMFASGMTLLAKPGGNSLTSYVSNVRHILNSLDCAEGRTRVQPVGLFIQGPSGCGKTTIVDELAAIVKAHEDLPDSNTVMYYNMTAKFQDGMVGNPRVIVFNDFLSTKEEFMEANVVDTLQMMTDTAAFNVNRASVEAKENSEIFPILTIVTANPPTYMCSKSSNAEKLNRRYNTLTVTFTAKALEDAARLKIPVEKLIETTGTTSGYVKLVYGTPSCAGPTINMTVNKALPYHEFDSWESFLVFYVDTFGALYDGYKRHYNTKNVVRRCSVGLKLPHPEGLACPCLQKTLVEEESRPLPPLSFGRHDLLEEEDESTSLPVLRFGPSAVVVQGPAARLSTLDLESSWAEMLFAFLYTVLMDPIAFSMRVPIFLFFWFCAPVYLSFVFLLSFFAKEKTFRGRMPSGLLPFTVYWLLYLPWFWYNPLVGVYVTFCAAVDPRHRLCIKEILLGIEYRSKRFLERQVSFSHYFGGFFRANKYRIAASTLASLSLILGALILAKKVFVEGNLMGTPNNIPDERKPIVPIRGVVPPALGGKLSSGATISRAGHFTMRCTVVDNLRIIVPSHFIRRGVVDYDTPPIKDGDLLTLDLNGKRYEFPFDDKSCVQLNNLYGPVDACVLATHNSLWNAPSTLVFTDDHFAGVGGVVRNHDVAITTAPDYRYGMTYSPIVLSFGDCGEPLYVNEFFVGIHAGRYSLRPCAVAVRVTKRMFVEACERLKPLGHPIPVFEGEVTVEGLSVGLHPKSDASWLEKEERLSIPYRGHLQTKNTVKMTGKPSELYSIFGSRCEEYVRPNVGHAKKNADGEYVSIATRNLDGFGRPRVLDPNLAREVLDTLTFSSSPVPVGFLSLHQVLTGDSANAYINPRDDDKAIGPTLRSKGVTKRQVTPMGDGCYTVAPALLEEIAEKEERVKHFRAYRVRIEGVIKDELITAANYEKGKGRYFFVSDLSDNLLLKMYAGNVFSTILSDTQTHSCFAGLNAGSNQWRDLANHITFEGKRMMVSEGDQTQFDRRHGIFNGMYTEYILRQAVELGYSDSEIRSLTAVLYSSFHILMDLEGNFFETDSSLGSGRADTIIYNSIVHRLMFLYAFMKLWKLSGKAVHVSMWEQLRLALVGDDVLWNSMLPGFTVDYVADVFLGLGYTLTSPRKDGLLWTEMPITEVTFLKRRFRYENGYVFAPLAEESLYRTLAYVTGKGVERERTLSVLTSIQGEWFLHGKESLQAFHEDLVKVENLLGITVKRKTYDELLSAYDGGELKIW